jgi:L-fucose isomerase-like protein
VKPARVGVVPIVRPLFRGARMGLWPRSLAALEDLAGALGFDLAYACEPIADADDARRRAGEAAAADLDLLLIHHVTFATGDLVAPFLELPMPVGVWALPEAATDGPLPQNALCGLNMTLSLPIERAAPPFWVYGDGASNEVRAGLARAVAAARGWRVAQRGRVLWVGGTAPGFYGLEWAPDLPVRLERAPLDAFFDAWGAVSELDAEARAAEMDEPSDLPRDALRAAARNELALHAIGRDYDGVALRCWPEIPERTGAMTCAAFARLGDRGAHLACEGDAGGVVSMIVAAAVAGAPAILLDLAHVDGDALQFWHCGNAPRVWAAGTSRLEPHFNRGAPAVRGMRLRPGPASGLRFLDGGRYVTYAGVVSPRADVYQGVSGWFEALRWDGVPLAARRFVANVLDHRLPHHFTWVPGDVEDALRMLCVWLRRRAVTG